MDYSIRGYLSRCSKRQLEQIISIYSQDENTEFYASMLDMARHFLEKRIAEGDMSDAEHTE